MTNTLAGYDRDLEYTNALEILGEEKFRSMTFSQQATLTSDIDLTPYLEPDCFGELTIKPEETNEGCFTVPGGPDGGWLFEIPEFGAKIAPVST